MGGQLLGFSWEEVGYYLYTNNVLYLNQHLPLLIRLSS